MPNHVKEYVFSVLKAWGTHISGPILASVGIGPTVAAVHFGSDPSAAVWFVKLSAELTVSSAVLLIFVAQFDVWKLERVKLEAEENKNLKPELYGELQSFKAAGFHGESNAPTCFTDFSCYLFLCNRRPGRTALKDLFFDGANLPKPAIFSQIIITEIGDIEKATPPVLEHGVGVPLTISGHIEFPGYRWHDLASNIALADLRICAVDSFDARHILSIRPGEVFRKP